MASSLRNLSAYKPDEIPDGKDFRIGIVVSEYNSDITFSLRDACLETLEKNGVQAENVAINYVPGAFELTFGAKVVFEKLYSVWSGKPDAIICLGCVIKGDTQHDEYINHAIAQGLTQLSNELSTPLIFGVLTPNDHAQALERAGGKLGNKGVEAAIAALKMAKLASE